MLYICFLSSTLPLSLMRTFVFCQLYYITERLQKITFILSNCDNYTVKKTPPKFTIIGSIFWFFLTLSLNPLVS